MANENNVAPVQAKSGNGLLIGAILLVAFFWYFGDQIKASWDKFNDNGDDGNKPIVVRPDKIAEDAMDHYASASADALEYFIGKEYKTNSEFQKAIEEATKQARIESFKEVNALVNSEVGEDRWDNAKKDALLTELAKGYRNASK